MESVAPTPARNSDSEGYKGAGMSLDVKKDDSDGTEAGGKAQGELSMQ